ncbi:14321_t:CDS:2 [Ambispora leptoticha]|uniref:14321_t:CDS:1 n=1 Tax=Ambispora leptoticha TaxID=144679 RepID=A0A9N9A9C8_9GLOM|nr:14321_t:CDS:2 [Ambispora leptoticha]
MPDYHDALRFLYCVHLILLDAALYILPILALCLIPNIFILLIWFPAFVGNVYRYIYFNKHIGSNLKFVVFLFSPVLIVLYLPVGVLVCVTYTIWIVLLGPIIEHSVRSEDHLYDISQTAALVYYLYHRARGHDLVELNADNPDLEERWSYLTESPAAAPFNSALQLSVGMWSAHSKIIPEIVNDEKRYQGNTIDFAFWRLVVGVSIFPFYFFVTVPTTVIVAIIFYIPLLIRCEIILWKTFATLDIFYAIVTFLGFVVMTIALVPLIVVGDILLVAIILLISFYPMYMAVVESTEAGCHASVEVAVDVTRRYMEAATGLQPDLIDFDGLQYFKKNNLTNSKVANPILASLKSNTNKALQNKNPYSVTNTTQIPPNGDKHYYYSWAVYWWPDCSGVPSNLAKDPAHNCPYKQRDGQYIPDLNDLSDPTASVSMIDDVFSLSISYALFGDEKYAIKAIQLLQVWFLNNDTAMAPNVEYGQVIRGPGNWTGRAEGILDLRNFVYIPPSIQILKNSTSWNSDMDNGMKNWFTQYIDWLQNSSIGKTEGAAPNNHGTYYVVQLATYLDYIGKDDEAVQVIKQFVNKQFQSQISKNGDQPLESRRTRPWHYQCFNLVGLTYIAQLSERLKGPNLWTLKTSSGATIQDAINYVANESLSPSDNRSECLIPLYLAQEYYGNSFSSILTNTLAESQTSDEYWLLWNPRISGDTKHSDASHMRGGGVINSVLICCWIISVWTFSYSL